MEKLIEQMKMDMELQDYSPKTIDSYMKHIQDFSSYFHGSITDRTEDDIRKYLYYVKKEKEYGRSYISQVFSAIKFLYRETIDMPISLNKLRGPKRMIKLPVVLSQDEVRQLFDATDNHKHRMIFMVMYSAGLRVNEAVNLKVTDIDSKRMQIRVRQGKGRKDRYTLLSKILLKHLQEYWLAYRPEEWLFPSKHKTTPVVASTIQRIFKTVKKSRNTKRRFTPYPQTQLCNPSFRTGC